MAEPAARLQFELNEQLVRNMPAGIVATNVGIAVVMVVALWDVAPQAVLLGLLGSIALVSLIRMLLRQIYLGRTTTDGDAARRWSQRFSLFSGLNGLVWGAGASLLLPVEPLPETFLLPLAIAGLSAGVIASQSASLPYALSYLWLAVIPPAVTAIALGGPAYLALGILMGLFTLAMTVFALNNHAIQLEGIRLQLDKDELVEALRRNQAELEDARDRAEQADQAKSQVIGHLSHELRTPLNGLLGMIKLLQDSPLSDDQRDYVDTLNRSARTLTSILEDLTSLSKSEAERIRAEQIDFDLNRLIDGLTGLLGMRAEARGLRLATQLGDDVPQTVRGDPVKLRQVLLTLIGNAIRFTDVGGVTLSIENVTQASEPKMPQDGTIRLLFAVTDTSIGMPDQERRRMFDRLGDGTLDIAGDRPAGGGLSLHGCRRLVETMGGRIDVESKVGEGSTFWFVLPLHPAGAITAQPAPAARKSLPPLDILVAEDMLLNQKVVGELLKRGAHRVRFVNDGPGAVAAVREGQFDMVLMDVRMPGYDGLEATRRIRALDDRQRAATPIIAMTAHVLEEDIRQCREAGMDGFVPKPIDSEVMAAAIDAAWQKRAAASPEASRQSSFQPFRRTLIFDAEKLSRLHASMPESDFKAMTDLALQTVPEACTGLLQAHQRGDDQMIRRTALLLSDSAADLGLDELAGTASQLEIAAQQGRRAEIDRLVSALPGLVELSLESFRKPRALPATLRAVV